MSAISTDGRCGPTYNKRCPNPLCCSIHGWCGGSIGTKSSWCNNQNGNSWIGINNGSYDGKPSPSPSPTPAPTPSPTPAPAPTLPSTGNIYLTLSTRPSGQTLPLCASITPDFTKLFANNMPRNNIFSSINIRGNIILGASNFIYMVRYGSTPAIYNNNINNYNFWEIASNILDVPSTSTNIKTMILAKPNTSTVTSCRVYYSNNSHTALPITTGGTNPIVWTSVTFEDNSYSGIVYGNNMFVLYGNNSKIATTFISDTNWVPSWNYISIDGNYKIINICFNDGIFLGTCISSDTPTKSILIWSIDGIIWYQKEIPHMMVLNEYDETTGYVKKQKILYIQKKLADSSIEKSWLLPCKNSSLNEPIIVQIKYAFNQMQFKLPTKFIENSTDKLWIKAKV